MTALNDTMARIAILRSEVLSLTHTLDARAANARPGIAEQELTSAATALMQAAISLQQAENSARRSTRVDQPHHALT